MEQDTATRDSQVWHMSGPSPQQFLSLPFVQFSWHWPPVLYNTANTHIRRHNQVTQADDDDDDDDDDDESIKLVFAHSYSKK